MTTEITYIDIASVRPFVSRARPREGFERIKNSIREMGLYVPIQVRDISDWSKDKRGQYKYELIVGEGRLKACKELKLQKIPALIVDVPESEVVGRFLAENVMRKKLPWQSKARLIKEEVDRIGLPTKADLEVLAKRYFITVPHVSKLVKILKQASGGTQKSLNKLTVQEAETLTSLPAKGQDIVIDLMSEEGISQKDIGAVVKRAKSLGEEDKELSKTALKASLKRDSESLQRLNKSLKPLRLHYSNGPENIMGLLSDPKYRQLLDSSRINYARFESAMKEGM